LGQGGQFAQGLRGLPTQVVEPQLHLVNSCVAWRARRVRSNGGRTLAGSGLAIIRGRSMADAAQKVVKAVCE
jgi:hypothetical protein